MKLSRTILPALAMLVIATVMLSTASFAWFAMNPTVDANGMQVNIKSESEFLLIQAIGTVDGTLTAGSFTSANTSASGDAFYDVDALFPSAHHATTAADFKNPAKWYTGEGNTATDGTLTGGEVALNTKDGGLNNYVMRYKYGVILSPGSAPAEELWISDLQITDSDGGDLADTLDPIRVVITSEETTNIVELFSYNLASQNGTKDLTGTGEGDGFKVTDSAVTYIYVYIYYDGNDTSVTSANLAKLAGATVEFSLTTLNPND